MRRLNFFNKIQETVSKQTRGERYFLVLRIFTIIFPIIAIAAFCWALTQQYGVYTDDFGSLGDIWPVGPLAYALVWSTVALILTFLFNISIHIGVYISFDLVAWSLLISFSIVGVVLFGYTYSYASCYRITDNCSTYTKRLAAVERLGVVIMMLDSLVHFALFVRACRVCNVLRKKKKRERESFIKL